MLGKRPPKKHRKICETVLIPGIPSIPGISGIPDIPSIPGLLKLWNLAEIVKWRFVFKYADNLQIVKWRFVFKYADNLQIYSDYENWLEFGNSDGWNIKIFDSNGDVALYQFWWCRFMFFCFVLSSLVFNGVEMAI